MRERKSRNEDPLDKVDEQVTRLAIALSIRLQRSVVHALTNVIKRRRNVVAPRFLSINSVQDPHDYVMSYLGNDLENEQSRERSHVPCESRLETGNEEPLNLLWKSERYGLS